MSKFLNGSFTYEWSSADVSVLESQQLNSIVHEADETKHRLIDDITASATTLYSGSKIESLIPNQSLNTFDNVEFKEVRGTALFSGPQADGNAFVFINKQDRNLDKSGISFGSGFNAQNEMVLIQFASTEDIGLFNYTTNKFNWKASADTGGFQIAHQLTLGDGVNSYQLPIDKSTASNNDLLMFNSATSALEFRKPITSKAEIYIGDNPTETIFTATNQYQLVAGSYTTYAMDDFSLQGGNNVRYDGLDTKWFRVVAELSAETEEKKQNICRGSIFRNGIDMIQSNTIQSVTSSNDFPQQFTISVMVQLSANDTVSVRIQNATAVEDIVVSFMHLHIFEI